MMAMGGLFVGVVPVAMVIQPSPTSSDIITIKPKIEVQEASFPFPLRTTRV